MTLTKEIEISNVYVRTYEAYINPQYNLIVNQGGTGSTKSYSTMQVLKRIADEQAGIDIEVCAITTPHFKDGVLKDLINILNLLNEYETRVTHNRSNHIFTFPNKSTISFNSYENSGKARGPRRDILYINEWNLFDQETYRQLAMRTRSKIFTDYNPADEVHWCYDEVDNRADACLIISTYIDGKPFLTASNISEIEKLKEIDENLWRVYGLGQRGVGRSKIYSNYQIIDDYPYSKTESSIGVDFGYNVPSAAVLCGLYDNNVYWKELIYQAGLTTPAIAERLLQIIEELKLSQDIPVYCDSAEPDRIVELQNAGINAKKANKSVRAGIDFVRGVNPDQEVGSGKYTARKLFITKDSVNTRQEISQYKNKEGKNGQLTDEPVKFMDHAMDAARYGSYTHYLEISAGVDAASIIDTLY